MTGTRKLRNPVLSFGGVNDSEEFAIHKFKD
jgi:hypothetical protein